jgi:hypothetical protein
MRVHKSWRVETACAKPHRYGSPTVHLESPHLVKWYEGWALAATNTHWLYVQPVEVEEGDEPGAVPSQAIKDGRRFADRKGYYTLTCGPEYVTVAGSGIMYPRPMGTFPKFEKVIPKGNPEARVALDSRYLEAIANAGKVGKSCQVEIQHYGEKDAMRILANRSTAIIVLMPVEPGVVQEGQP